MLPFADATTYISSTYITLVLINHSGQYIMMEPFCLLYCVQGQRLVISIAVIYESHVHLESIILKCIGTYQWFVNGMGVDFHEIDIDTNVVEAEKHNLSHLT